MDESNEYIMLSKSFINNCLWFHESKMLQVFIWILANACPSDGECFKTIGKGRIETKNKYIAYHCGMTIANVRTALAKLELSGKITRKHKNHSQIITVVNYDSYILSDNGSEDNG